MVIDLNRSFYYGNNLGKGVALTKNLVIELGDFEKHYQIHSTDFYASYQCGELGDDIDFVEWSTTIDMLQSINQQIAILRKVNINNMIRF